MLQQQTHPMWTAHFSVFCPSVRLIAILFGVCEALLLHQCNNSPASASNIFILNPKLVPSVVTQFHTSEQTIKHSLSQHDWFELQRETRRLNPIQNLLFSSIYIFFVSCVSREEINKCIITDKQSVDWCLCFDVTINISSIFVFIRNHKKVFIFTRIEWKRSENTHKFSVVVVRSNIVQHTFYALLLKENW